MDSSKGARILRVVVVLLQSKSILHASSASTNTSRTLDISNVWKKVLEILKKNPAVSFPTDIRPEDATAPDLHVPSSSAAIRRSRVSTVRSRQFDEDTNLSESTNSHEETTRKSQWRITRPYLLSDEFVCEFEMRENKEQYDVIDISQWTIPDPSEIVSSAPVITEDQLWAPQARETLHLYIHARKDVSDDIESTPRPTKQLKLDRYSDASTRNSK